MEMVVIEQQTIPNFEQNIAQALEQVKTQINNLPLDVRNWYNFIPARCWMTAANQAKAVKTRLENIRTYKDIAKDNGIINLEIHENGKRKNPKHVIQKRETYYTLILESMNDASLVVDDDAIEYDLINCMDWSLLKNKTAEDLNKMPKLELIEFYMEAGFLVLPTNYIVFKNIGGEVKPTCSCFRGQYCKSPGKHPVHGYKYLTPSNYPYFKKQYLDEFRANPKLNPGAKVFGYSVIDVDGRNGGLNTFKQLQLQSWAIGEHLLDESLKIKTAGGFHLYVQNEAIGNHANYFGAGVDVRSERGFHVLPGAMHKSGTIYEFESVGTPGVIPSSWFYEPTDKPDKVSRRSPGPEHFENHRTKMHSIQLPKVLDANYVIPKGYREPTLFKFAARERGLGKCEGEIYEILGTIRDTYCVDSHEITDGDLRRLATHICEPQFKVNADSTIKIKGNNRPSPFNVV